MQDFIIEGTKKSPKIVFDSSTHSLSIHGRSIMSNLDDDFYNPVFDILQQINTSKPSTFNLEFKLDYFNTSSHLSIIKILKEADIINSNSIDTQVTWAYSSDDTEMKEIGQEMQKFCDIPFIYKSVE